MHAHFNRSAVRSAAPRCRVSSALVPPSLIRNVVDPMRGLVADIAATKIALGGDLEQLVGLGDLIRVPRPLQVRLRRPVRRSVRFIPRCSGSVILVGISADQMSALPPDLESRIEALGSSGTCGPSRTKTFRANSVQIGLIEIPYDRWTKAPRPNGGRST